VFACFLSLLIIYIVVFVTFAVDAVQFSASAIIGSAYGLIADAACEDSNHLAKTHPP
jgi:hypothetical protein